MKGSHTGGSSRQPRLVVWLTMLAVLAGLVFPPVGLAVVGPGNTQTAAGVETGYAPEPVQESTPAPKVKISQIYGGGGNSGADYKNDYIELFNTGTSPVSLEGWSVQYAPSGGSTWAITELGDLTIAPGGYVLIQQAAGAGGTLDLPTPDTTGTIGMSSTAGKVALVGNTTALTGSCPVGEIIDFAGYGAANCYEGEEPAPVLSNTTAAFRKGAGCTDTGENGSDFSVGAPAPRNSASPWNACAAPIKISQVYGGGGLSDATYTNDYVELFNPGQISANLEGWSVQYASESGTNWISHVLPDKAIPPGGYLLIRYASNNVSIGSPLPTPDVTGTINLSSATGKVALFNTGTPSTGYCPDQEYIDLVGYGSTVSCNEGSGGAPRLSNTTAALRAGEGCIDTNDNAADFTAGPPYPRNSATPKNYCGTPPPSDLIVSIDGPAFAERGEEVEFTLTASIEGDQTADNVILTGTLPAGLIFLSDTSGLTPSNPEPGIYIWTLDELTAGNDLSFTLLAQAGEDLLDGAVLISQISASATLVGDDPANNTAQLQTTIYNVVPIAAARAGAIGQIFAVEGVVTVQPGMISAQEWAIQDESGGIAAFFSPVPVVQLGDTVRVRAARSQFNGQEQLQAPVSFVQKISIGPEVVARPAATQDITAGTTEGWLVVVEGVVSGLSSCSGNYSFLVDDGSGPAQIFVNSNTGVNLCAMGVHDGSMVRITGYSSQYASTYQVKVRRPADAALIHTTPGISKTAPHIVAPAQVFTYTITVENYLGYDLHDVVVEDSLPDNVEYIAGGTFDEGFVKWEIPTIPDQETIQLQFSVAAPSASGQWIYNSDYSITASNFATPTYGTGVYTAVDEGLRIRHLQGPGHVTPYEGQLGENIYGIVTRTTNQGFFMQDPEPDDLELTSEGIFVYAGTAPGVVVGDAVTVTGKVSESYNMTQMSSATWTSAPASQVIEPVVITLPADPDLERYEGMLVTIPQELTVSQNYFLGRYGQLTLSSGGRMFHPLNGSGLGDSWELNLRRMLVLDDGTSTQNPTPVPYLDEEHIQRAGEKVENLTGVIDYGVISSSNLRHYRLQPTEEPVFMKVHPRMDAPEETGGSLKVASFNVLNYFNGDGQGGGFPTSRGATTQLEFERQRTKIIAAILALDADIVGLMEIENDGVGAHSAVQDLVNGLNAAAGTGTFAFVAEPAPGVDEIKVSLIYRQASVTPVGPASNYQVNDHPVYTALFDRPPLAQTFTENASGEAFSVVVNHFKSKSSCPSSGIDADQGDGQGCWNAKRKAQASGLLDFVALLAQADPDVLVIGDLNSYGAEEPVEVLLDGGLQDQIARFVPAAGRYTYTFDGMAGYLDHALSTPSLASRITGTTTWHINTDEPSILDYNLEFRPANLYSPDPYRSSDHDPVVVSLELGLLAAGFTSNTPILRGEQAIFTNTSVGPGPMSYQWSFGDGDASMDMNPSHMYEAAGIYNVSLSVSNPFDTSTSSATYEVIERLLASFESPSPAHPGEAVYFTNTTTGPGTVVFEWDFGDGSPPVSESNPVHTFAETGVYTVTLKAENPYETSSASKSIHVVTPEALVITKTSSIQGMVAQPGEVVTYTISLTNTGETAAENISLEDVLPELVEWAGWVEHPEGLNYEEGVITWNGELESGADLTFSYTAVLSTGSSVYGAQVTNTVEFNSAAGSSGAATSSFNVAAPQLSIQKRVNTIGPAVKPGESISYIVTVRNNGSSDAAGVHIVDVLPEGILGESLDITVTIASGEAITVTIPAVVADNVLPGSTITNLASFSHPTGSASASASIIVVQDLTQHGYKLFLPMVRRTR